MEFRKIPGYNGYEVSANGVIKSAVTGNIISTYLWDGYRYADVRLSGIKSIRVNRAVALAWVVNPDPQKFKIVNHLDGDKENNNAYNLEWSDHAGNNMHAVENGLRPDCIKCLVRDFETKQITAFASINRALVFMGLPEDSSHHRYMPKKYGSLVNDRYEFKFADDEGEWFYENREERIPPSRFMLEVYEGNGQVKEYYSTKNILKEFQLYKSKDRSILGLAHFAAGLYPDKKFVVRDSYIEPTFRYRKRTKLNTERIEIKAVKGDDFKMFFSMTKCAEEFNVDRSVIKKRLLDRTDLDGWTFVKKPAARVTE